MSNTLYRNDIYGLNEDARIDLLEEHGIKAPNSLESYEAFELIEEQGIALFDSLEDDILDSLYNGNWSYGAEQMLEEHINPQDIANYIEEAREEIEEAYSWFDLSHMTALCSVYYSARAEVA